MSRIEAAKHRERIVSVAAKLFRERGIADVSVAEVMAAAGLTHGGFYGHFRSKDELAAEACRQAFTESRARWSRRILASADKGAALEKIVNAYLDAAHRDGAGPLCAAAAFAADVDRQQADRPIHDSFLEGFDGLVSELAGVYATDTDDGRTQALTAFATMAGALVLARATRGQAVSDEILEAARVAVLKRFEVLA